MTGGPRPSSSGGNDWSRCSRPGPGTPCWTSAAVPGCACRCCRTRSGPPEPSSASTPPSRCSGSPPTRSPRAAGTTSGSSPPRPNRRRSTAPRTLPCSARCTTCCNPGRRWAASSSSCVPARRWPRAAGNCPGPWLRHMRGWVRALHAPFIADFTGFDKPWRLLAEFVPDLQVHEHALGAGYLAVGPLHAGTAVTTGAGVGPKQGSDPFDVVHRGLTRRARRGVTSSGTRGGPPTRGRPARRWKNHPPTTASTR